MVSSSINSLDHAFFPPEEHVIIKASLENIRIDSFEPDAADSSAAYHAFTPIRRTVFPVMAR